MLVVRETGGAYWALYLHVCEVNYRAATGQLVLDQGEDASYYHGLLVSSGYLHFVVNSPHSPEASGAGLLGVGSKRVRLGLGNWKFA